MKKDDKMVRQALLLILQIGINMLVPILACTFVGVWLGNKFGISWLAIPFFFVGALAGYNSIFKLVKKFMDVKDDKGRRDVKKD